MCSVGVVSLDPASVRTHLCREVTCHLRVEDRSVEVRSHLAHDEAWPDALESHGCKSALELAKEGVECGLVRKTSVNLLSTDLIRNLRKVP